MSRVLLALLAWAAPAAAQGPRGEQQQQVQPLPAFFPSDLKDDWYDMEKTDPPFGEPACGLRLEMLKKMSLVSEAQMGHFRAQVLEGLGVCAMLNMEDFGEAAKKLRSAISEIEMLTHRSESDFLKIPQLQPYAILVFMQQGAAGMAQARWGDAAMSFRRAKAVFAKQLDKDLKTMAKQNKLATADEIKSNFEAVRQKVMPHLAGQRMFVVLTEKVRAMDEVLKKLDKAAVYNTQRSRAVSENKYLPGILYSDTAWSGGHAIVADLKTLKFPKTSDLPAKAQVALLSPMKKPTKGPEGGKKKKGTAPDCDSGVWAQFCETLSGKKYYSDVASNIFGGAKILNAKKGEGFQGRQKLEMCESNAAIGLLLSAEDMTLHYAETKAGTEPAPAATIEVKGGTPTFVNYCRPLELSRSAPVLFVQMWHPEVAPVERTSLIRGAIRDKEHADGLAELVNEASSQWEKTKKEFQKSEDEEAVKRTCGPDANTGAHHYCLHHKILPSDLFSDKKKSSLAKEAERAAEAEAQGEEARLNSMKRLQAEREAKEQEALEKEAKRKAASKRANEEAAARLAEKKKAEPWRMSIIRMKNRETGKKGETTLQAEYDYLEELRAAKRALDMALEFQETKDKLSEINAQERRCTSAEKLAKKAWKKKGEESWVSKKGKKEESSTESTAEQEPEAVEESKAEEPKEAEPKAAKSKVSKRVELQATISQLETQIETFKGDKETAVKNEDFKTAKEAKANIERLKGDIKKYQKELAELDSSKEEL